MATKLDLYNKALSGIGGRRLSSLTEEREPRYLLDSVYDLNAVEACLEVAKPVFARKTKKLTTSSVSAEHGLDNVFDLPADYVALVPDGVYSNELLDQEVGRYLIEGRTLACEFDTLYIRYVTDSVSIDDWSPSFLNFVAAYLGKEIATRLDGAEQERADALYQARLEEVLQLNLAEEPRRRADQTSYTLNSDWLKVYNDALLILGLEKIVNVNDDSQRRAQLDTAMNADLVEFCMEDTGWNFGLTSVKLEYDPSVEPSFGYQRAIAKPADLLRVHGVYHDEYMQVPLKRYADEGDYFFTDENELYLQYVDRDFLTTPQNWPIYFRKYVAARLAYEAGPSIPGANVDNAISSYQERKYSAMANDVMNGPPRTIANGNWTSSRYAGISRDRPGYRR